jgi:hypothetical protein
MIDSCTQLAVRVHKELYMEATEGHSIIVGVSLIIDPK